MTFELPLDASEGLRVGEKYPRPLDVGGAAMHTVGRAEHVVQVCIQAIKRPQILALRRDPVQIGIVSDGPAVILVIRIGRFGLECPIDHRLIPTEVRANTYIHCPLRSLRLYIHIVDETTSLLEAVRSVTFSSDLTDRFLSAIRIQLVDKRDSLPFLQKFKRAPPFVVLARARVELCVDITTSSA